MQDISSGRTWQLENALIATYAPCTPFKDTHCFGTASTWFCSWPFLVCLSLFSFSAFSHCSALLHPLFHSIPICMQCKPHSWLLSSCQRISFLCHPFCFNCAFILLLVLGFAWSTQKYRPLCLRMIHFVILRLPVF